MKQSTYYTPLFTYYLSWFSQQSYEAVTFIIIPILQMRNGGSERSSALPLEMKRATGRAQRESGSGLSPCNLYPTHLPYWLADDEHALCLGGVRQSKEPGLLPDTGLNCRLLTQHSRQTDQVCPVPGSSDFYCGRQST